MIKTAQLDWQQDMARVAPWVLGSFAALFAVLHPLMFVGFAAAVGIIVSGVLYPQWILYTMVFTLPLQGVLVLTAGANVKISELLGCVLIVAVGIRFLVWDEAYVSDRRIAAPLAMFLVFAVLSTLNTPRFRSSMTLNYYMLQGAGRDSPDVRSYLTALWGVYCAMLLVSVATVANTMRRLRGAFHALLWGAAGAAGLGIFQWIYLLDAGVPYELPGSTQHLNVLHSMSGGFPRSPSSFTEPSVYGFFLILMLPITLALAVGHSPRIFSRRIATVLFVLECVGLLLSFSVSGYVLFGVVLLAFGYLAKRNASGTKMTWLGRKAVVVVMLLLTVVALLQFVGVYPADVGEFVAERLFGEADSAQIRFGLARVAVNMAGDHYLTGVGIGNFPFLALGDPEVRTITNIELQMATPSNLYLLYLAELGVPGFLLFLWMVSGIGRFVAEHLRTLPQEYRLLHVGLCASLFGAVLSFLFLDNPFVNYLWVIVGLTLAVVRVAYRDASTESGRVQE